MFHPLSTTTIILASFPQTAAFHVHVSSRGTRTRTSSISFPPPITPATQVFEFEYELRSTIGSDDVACVSVCTAELCQCQGDDYEHGGAADALIANLRSRHLPFPVEESGCLGTCGMGTTVAIEYQNGSASLVAGWDQTLTELGLATGMDVDVDVAPESESMNDNVASLSTVETKTIPCATPQTQTQTPPRATQLDDTRDRMRAEADGFSITNPWINIAGYLAQKARDKLFGDSR
jgi:hypothetical protein